MTQFVLNSLKQESRTSGVGMFNQQSITNYTYTIIKH